MYDVLGAFVFSALQLSAQVVECSDAGDHQQQTRSDTADWHGLNHA
jgi:hypothetical protein